MGGCVVKASMISEDGLLFLQCRPRSSRRAANCLCRPGPVSRGPRSLVYLASTEPFNSSGPTMSNFKVTGLKVTFLKSMRRADYEDVMVLPCIYDRNQVRLRASASPAGLRPADSGGGRSWPGSLPGPPSLGPPGPVQGACLLCAVVMHRVLPDLLERPT